LVSSAFETVLLNVDRGVAHVLLDRPDKRNAFNVQMRDDLFQVLEAIRDDPEVRAVLISGAGEQAFCAGADLSEFGTAPSQAIARQGRWERDVWGLWASIHKPFVAAMHGYVLGSGVEMAMLCDLRIASEDAVFGLPEVGLGMIPAAGGTQTLPRILGVAPALDLLLTGRRIAAGEALDLGLVHRVVAKERLWETAGELAEQLAARDPQLMSAAKTAVSQGTDIPLEAGLALERRLALRLALRS
jgi:enoyl-CoA hydratase/carnithine racemase